MLGPTHIFPWLHKRVRHCSLFKLYLRTQQGKIKLCHFNVAYSVTLRCSAPGIRVCHSVQQAMTRGIWVPLDKCDAFGHHDTTSSIAVLSATSRGSNGSV